MAAGSVATSLATASLSPVRDASCDPQRGRAQPAARRRRRRRPRRAGAGRRARARRSAPARCCRRAHRRRRRRPCAAGRPPPARRAPPGRSRAAALSNDDHGDDDRVDRHPGPASTSQAATRPERTEQQVDQRVLELPQEPFARSAPGARPEARSVRRRPAGVPLRPCSARGPDQRPARGPTRPVRARTRRSAIGSPSRWSPSDPGSHWFRISGGDGNVGRSRIVRSLVEVEGRIVVA